MGLSCVFPQLYVSWVALVLCAVCVHTTVHMWKSGNNLVGLVPPFPLYIGSGARAHATRSAQQAPLLSCRPLMVSRKDLV